MAINATAIWRIRPSGSNTNGGGYDPGISGAATDYSQQNSAQASGTAGTASASTTFSDAVAANFTSAMVGNALYLTGTGFTTGFYFVTGYTSSTTVTLDRSPGTGTAGTWHLGGGWATFVNLASSTAYIVAGNTVYVLGSGISSPGTSNFDYNVSSSTNMVNGSPAAGYVRLIGDPATSGGVGVPVIKLSTSGCFGTSTAIWWMQNLFFVYAFNGADVGSIPVFINTVHFQNGHTCSLSGSSSVHMFIGNEVYDTAASTYTTAFFIAASSYAYVINNNFHDTQGPAISIAASSGTLVALNNIFSNIGGSTSTYVIQLDRSATTLGHLIMNNTFDNPTGNALVVTTLDDLFTSVICNNIFSNCQGSGTYAVSVSAGTAGPNTQNCPYFNYNYYYNNINNLNGINNGPNDITGGGNPYTAQSTENYTPVTAITNNGMWGAPYPQHTTGDTNTVQTYSTTGAVQPQGNTSGTTVVVNKIRNVYSSEEGGTPSA